MSSTTVELNIKDLSFKGNLDADKIRTVCFSHGIELHPDKTCKGGKFLKDIKEKRNCLAHGTLSFAECGRDFSLSDLTLLKDQTYKFLDSMLDGMEQYYNGDGFLIFKNYQK
jgi:hypothetical protein